MSLHSRSLGHGLHWVTLEMELPFCKPPPKPLCGEQKPHSSSKITPSLSHGARHQPLLHSAELCPYQGSPWQDCANNPGDPEHGALLCGQNLIPDLIPKREDSSSPPSSPAECCSLKSDLFHSLTYTALLTNRFRRSLGVVISLPRQEARIS